MESMELQQKYGNLERAGVRQRVQVELVRGSLVLTAILRSLLCSREHLSSLSTVLAPKSPYLCSLQLDWCIKEE